MQEVSLRGQSRKSSEEGLQDELDVCVLVVHLGLRHRPYLEQKLLRRELFSWSSFRMDSMHSS